MTPAVAASSGFALGLSLIVAIGPQNAFVLRQGLRRSHVFPIALTCSLADMLLIFVGVFGIEVLTQVVPALAPILRFVGAGFLIVYGVLAARSAWQGGQSLEPEGAEAQGLWGALSLCLAFTFLNPHVYLDTLLVVGPTASQYPDQKLAFALGATAASFLFFFAQAYGARLLQPVFARPRAWQVLDILIALVMWAIAAKLLWPEAG